MKKLLAVIALMMFAGVAQAQITKNFQHRGFNNGLDVSGQFTCTDTNSDGYCGPNELSAFGVTVRQGAVVLATFTSLEIFSFAYKISTNTLEPIWVKGPAGGYDYIGNDLTSFGQVLNKSTTPATVTGTSGSLITIW